MKKSKHKPKAKKKRDKGANTMKVAQLVTHYACVVHPGVGRKIVLLDMRTMTPFQATEEQSHVMLKLEHKWTVVTSVLLDNKRPDGRLDVKSYEHPFSTPFKHEELARHYLGDYHAARLREERSDCLAGFAWIAVPRSVNLSERQIERIYAVAERCSPEKNQPDSCGICGDRLLFDVLKDRYADCRCQTKHEEEESLCLAE